MALVPVLVTDLHAFDVSRYGIEASVGGKGQWEPHLHSFHQFDATLAGRSWQAIHDHDRLDSEPGTGILIPPMVRHGHRTESWFEVGMFKFSLAPWAWAQLGSEPLRFALNASTLTKVREAGQAHAALSLWHEHQAIAALTECLVEAIRAVANGSAESPCPRTGSDRPRRRIRPASAGGPVGPVGLGGTGDLFQQELGAVLEAIERSPYDGWTVAGLATQCNLTPDHFTKRFRAALATGPQEYLLRARIRAAARSLSADGKLSIKAVAAAAGYATVHSFSRAFRQVTGISPARFRRQSGTL